MKILLLEDDPLISEIMKEHLEAKMYSIDHAYEISDALSKIEQIQYDLFIFDVNVPDGSGFELLEDLRRYQNKTPAIFITALNSTQDLKKGFQSGCDDYIKKPFDLDELDVRIEHIKKMYQIDQNIRITDKIVLEKENRTLLQENTKIQIREKEMQVLLYLVKNSKRSVSHEELVRNIWSFDETPSDATLRTYIKNLRQLIGPEYITTIKGVGYRFINT